MKAIYQEYTGNREQFRITKLSVMQKPWFFPAEPHIQDAKPDQTIKIPFTVQVCP